MRLGVGFALDHGWLWEIGVVVLGDVVVVLEPAALGAVPAVVSVEESPAVAVDAGVCVGHAAAGPSVSTIRNGSRFSGRPGGWQSWAIAVTSSRCRVE